MNYISSHLARERIQKQNNETSSLSKSLDEAIEYFDKLIKTVDDWKYKNKKYKRRKFIHKITGFEYELSHFEDFKNYRKEIIKDYMEYILPLFITIFFAVFVISFSIYMFNKN